MLPAQTARACCPGGSGPAGAPPPCTEPPSLLASSDNTSVQDIKTVANAMACGYQRHASLSGGEFVVLGKCWIDKHELPHHVCPVTMKA